MFHNVFRCTYYNNYMFPMVSTYSELHIEYMWTTSVKSNMYPRYMYYIKATSGGYTILQSPQSSSRTISATFPHRKLVLGPPLNVPSNIAQPIGSRSTFKNPATQSSMTPRPTGRTLSSRGKPSNTIHALAI